MHGDCMNLISDIYFITALICGLDAVWVTSHNGSGLFSIIVKSTILDCFVSNGKLIALRIWYLIVINKFSC